MLSMHDRRKKIIVDKDFQGRTTLIGLIYLFAVGISVAIPFVFLLRSANSIYADSPAELIMVMNSLKRFWIVVGPLSLLALVAAWIFFSLRRSHAVVGPIANITRIINEFAKGDFSARVKLRTQDQLQDIARALDTMAENLAVRERILNEKLIHRIQAAKEDIYENTSIKKAYAILADLEEDISKIIEKYPSSGEAFSGEKSLADS
jgi:methyl-accepting chemotaxis protein